MRVDHTERLSPLHSEGGIAARIQRIIGMGAQQHHLWQFDCTPQSCIITVRVTSCIHSLTLNFASPQHSNYSRLQHSHFRITSHGSSPHLSKFLEVASFILSK